MSFLSKIFGFGCCNCQKDCKCAPGEKCDCSKGKDCCKKDAPVKSQPVAPVSTRENPKA